MNQKILLFSLLVLCGCLEAADVPRSPRRSPRQNKGITAGKKSPGNNSAPGSPGRTKDFKKLSPRTQKGLGRLPVSVRKFALKAVLATRKAMLLEQKEQEEHRQLLTGSLDEMHLRSPISTNLTTMGSKEEKKGDKSLTPYKGPSQALKRLKAALLE